MYLDFQDFHKESHVNLLISVAEDFSEYPLDDRLDTYFAVQNYLWEGQADFDRLVDKIHVGKTNPRELLKFTNNKKVNFTR